MKIPSGAGTTPLCYRYVIIYAYSTKIILLQRSSVMLFHNYQYIFTSSKNEDNLSNRMGGLVRSEFQKVQRIHELEFLNDIFMLSLHYRLCGFYKDYAFEKKQYYMVLWFSVSFILHQRRKRIREIGWEVRFGQHFRRYR